MMDERELLQEIAFGTDPELRPADRLRALELLRELGPDRLPSPEFRDELAGLDGEELQAELDHIVAGLISTTSGEDLLRVWPETAQALVRRAEHRARELEQRRPAAPVVSIVRREAAD